MNKLFRFYSMFIKWYSVVIKCLLNVYYKWYSMKKKSSNTRDFRSIPLYSMLFERKN